MKIFKDEIYPKKDKLEPHLCSRGFVFDEEGRVGLIHIQTEDEFGKRDHYESPGGGLIGSEDYKECFKREIKEELGLLISDPIPFEHIYYEYNLLNSCYEAEVFYAYKIGVDNKNLTSLEKKIFKGVVYKRVDEWIEFLESNLGVQVNYLVQVRDLYLLKKLNKTLLLGQEKIE